MMGIKDEIDTELPTITSFRALPDVTSIGFEWKVPEGNVDFLSGYVIYRKDKKGQFQKIAFIKNILSTHYYDGKLQPQTEYEYAIAVVGENSHVSQKSDTLRVKTSFIDPVDFIYTSKNYAKRIKIFWSPSPNPIVKNYIVQRKDTKTNKFINIGSTNNRMSVEYFDDDLENGMEYTYRVIAQSYDGAKSLPSKIAIGQTRSAPNMIGGITTTNNKPHAIWIEWNPSDSKDVIGYSVWVADSESGNYTKLAFVRSPSYIDKIQENGVERFYKITAQDSYKLESSLQETPVKGQTLPPPQTPHIIESKIENNTAVIVWTPIEDERVKYYVVYRKSNNYNHVNRFDRIMNTNFIDANMEKDITYSYYVVSVDKFGIESLPSQTVTLSLNTNASPDITELPENKDNPSSSFLNMSNHFFAQYANCNNVFYKNSHFFCYNQ
ncbi:fibronectin type III domain-containing protein [Helicobacter aurati]|nr:fibronectin type III domain-containing protein [Helicobacter aurati]